MSQNNLSQKQVIFYLLYKNYKDKNEPMPPHHFMGECFVEPVNKFYFVSYEASARLSEMNTENPDLLKITPITGKSGARYFGYSLEKNVIADPKLKEMYLKIKNYEVKNEMRQVPQAQEDQAGTLRDMQTL